MPNIPITISISDRGAQAQIAKIGATISNLGSAAARSTASIRSTFNNTFNQINKQAHAFKSAASSAFGSASLKAQSASSSMRSSFIKTFQSMTSASIKAFKAIGAQSTSTSNQIKSNFNNVGNGLGGSSKSMNQFLTALAGGTAITLMANSMKNLAASAYEVSNAFFSANNALTAVTGSSKTAAEGMAFVQSEAMRLGQDVLTLSTSYSKLIAAGQSSGLTTKELQNVFTSLSETATVLSFSAQQTEGSFRALTQMLSKGKVQAEELRGQLGEHLPGAFEIAAQAMGKTTAELDKMLSMGQITAKGLLTALPAQLREAYGRGLPAALERSKVQFGILHNEAILFGRDVGESMEPAFKSLALLGRAFLNVLNEDAFKDNLGSMAETLNGWIKAVAQSLLDMRFGFIVLYGELEKGWLNFSTAIKTATIASTASISNAFTKMGGMFDVIVATLSATWTGAMNIIKEGWAGVLSLMSQGAAASGFDELSASLKATSDEISAGIIPAMDTLKDSIAEIKANTDLGIDDTTNAAVESIIELNKAQEIQVASIDSVVQSFGEERITIDELMTSTNAQMRSMENLTKANDAAAVNEKELKKIQTARLKAFESLQAQGLQTFNKTRTAQEEYIQTMDDLQTQLDAGVISQDTFNRAAEQTRGAMEKLLKDTGEMSLEFKDFFEAGFEGIGDSLADVFFDPTSENIAKMGEEFVTTMKRMAAEALANKALSFIQQSLGLGTADPSAQRGPLNTSPSAGAPNAPGVSSPTQQAVLDGALLSDMFVESSKQASNNLATGIVKGSTSASTGITEAMNASTGGIMESFASAGQGIWQSITGAFSQGGGGLSEIFSTSFSELGGLMSSLLSSIGSGLGGSSGGGGSGWGAVIGAVASAFAKNGKVFEGGNVKAFANGGVVSGPTNFPMSGGRMGLMGEAGPEAVMPLKRDSSGKLGVANSGGESGGVFTINLGIDSGIIVKTMDSPAGGRVIVKQATRNAVAMGNLRGT